MQYTEILKVAKNENFQQKKNDIFLIFAQNKDCFGAKIRKIGIPLHTPVLLYESGVQWGIHYTDMPNFSKNPIYSFLPCDCTC